VTATHPPSHRSASRAILVLILGSARRVGLGALVVVVALSACASAGPALVDATAPAAPTTGGTAPTTTAVPPAEATTTSTETPTTEALAPEAFSGDSVIQPGRYATSVFEPGVVFTLVVPLYVDEAECYLYFEEGPEEAASWLGFHAAWAGLGVDEVLDLVRTHPDIEIQAEESVTVAGLSARRLDGIAVRQAQDLYRVGGECEWWLEAGYVIRLYVVDVDGKTVVITIEVPLDVPSFLAVAEEIVESVRFEAP
jgi:hypothetical protein